jgi:hypothetical protein
MRLDFLDRGFGVCRGPLVAAFPALFATAAATTATVTTAAAVVGTGLAIATAAGAFTPKAASQASTINPNPTPTAQQTVDNSGNPDPSNPTQLGRAALIYTSGQGVQGSNPSNRYALLGNSSGLS